MGFSPAALAELAAKVDAVAAALAPLLPPRRSDGEDALRAAGSAVCAGIGCGHQGVSGRC